MPGIFYGVGVGPGDPGLLTLRAVQVLQEADVIITTDSRKQYRALTIIRPYLKDNVQTVELILPKNYPADTANSISSENKRIILDFLCRGKQIVFPTGGDPMLYSTYTYFFRLLQKEGYPLVTVPGVPFFCAVAARAGVPLAEEDEIISIVPAAVSREKMSEAIRYSESVLFLRAGNNVSQVIGCLEEAGCLSHSVLVSKAGFRDEKVLTDLGNLEAEDIHFISTILTQKPRKESAEQDAGLQP